VFIIEPESRPHPTPGGPTSQPDQPTALGDPGTGDDGLAAGEVPAQAGPYVIEGEVARGGNGIVLRGFDPAFRRHVAVKVLQARHRGRGEIERRFLAEARLTGQLQHPGIPAAYQIGQLDDGSPFFVMKLIVGRTLRELLAQRGEPTDGLAHHLELFEQVCNAVAYAHSKGVIHRDLKPSNIMVGRFGEVMVMDWGLAKFVPHQAPTRSERDEPEAEPVTLPVAGPGSAAVQSQMGSAFGTPSYMAPEQARGAVDRLTTACDVFGLGALLCEILTGKPPFDGPREQVRMQARLGHLEPAFQRLEASAAAPELIALARACLAPSPVDRPQDADQVARAVTAYREGGENLRRCLRRATPSPSGRFLRVPKTSADEPPAEQRGQWGRTLVLLVAALLVLLLAGVGGLLWGTWG
jgi:serine/threonine-protein kinase